MSNQLVLVAETDASKEESSWRVRVYSGKKAEVHRKGDGGVDGHEIALAWVGYWVF